MNNKENRKNKIPVIVTAAVFVAVVFGFFIWLILSHGREYSEKENRYLSDMPELSVDTFFDGTWMEDVEDFVSDQFPMRDTFIEAQSAMRLASGRQDNNNVYYGESLVSAFWNFDKDALEKNMKQIESIATKAEGNVYFVPVATAGEVLAEKPDLAPDIDQQALINYMKDRLDCVITIDPTESLKAAAESSSSYLYYKTDHHQTTYGAYIVYTEIMKAMGKDAIAESDFAKTVVAEDFTGTMYNKSGAWWTGADTIERWDYVGDGVEFQTAQPSESLSDAASFFTDSASVLPDSSDSLQGATSSFTVELSMTGEIYNSLYNESALDGADKYSYFLYGNKPVEVIRNDSAQAKEKLLIIKDSYAHAIVPFLANHYEEIHMIDLRYYRQDIQKYIEENGLEGADIIFIYNVEDLAGEE